MRKLIFIWLALWLQPSSAQLLAFNFDGIAGNEASVASIFQGQGVQSSSIIRGPGITPSPNLDRFNSSGWTTNISLDAGDYLQFSVSPAFNYTLTVTRIVVSYQRSPSGPRELVLRTDLDGFNALASDVYVMADGTSTQTDTIVLLSPLTISAPMDIRIYASAAESSSGSWGPGDKPGYDLIVEGTAVSGGPMISTGSLTPLPVCFSGGAQPAAANVPFVSSGSYNTMFNVYLSDASGNFASAPLVGSAAINGVDPSGTIPVTIPAGTPSGLGYRLRVDAVSPAITGTPGSPFVIVNGVPPATSLTGTALGTSARFRWTNPQGCFDELMMVVKEGAGTSAIPSGDGSAYVADADFQGAGTGFNSGKVVFKGTADSVTVTNLSYGKTYNIKVYTRRGLEWSSGTGMNMTLMLLPERGEILINQLSPDYGDVADEYVELVNTTGKPFNLAGLEIRYQSGGGNPAPITGGSLNGTMPPFGYWLLSPNTSVTVGLTRNLQRDGALNAGMATSSGQIALIRTSDNVIIDAVGYGAITGGQYTEGSPALSPSANGGLKRVHPTLDRNNNSIDFVRVSNADIYLRNSFSGVLPVRFAALTLRRKGQSVLIAFSNMTEEDVDHYSVERSSDGVAFTSLSKLLPTANRGGRADYQYEDGSALQGMNIYRIKAVENDGSTRYSGMEKISLSGLNDALQVYPNPAQGQAWMQVKMLPAGAYTMKIINVSGQVVREEVIQHHGGLMSKALVLKEFSPGIYTVEISGAVRLRKQIIIR
jgi:hypothetical protein